MLSDIIDLTSEVYSTLQEALDALATYGFKNENCENMFCNNSFTRPCYAKIVLNNDDLQFNVNVWFA